MSATTRKKLIKVDTATLSYCDTKYCGAQSKEQFSHGSSGLFLSIMLLEHRQVKLMIGKNNILVTL